MRFSSIAVLSCFLLVGCTKSAPDSNGPRSGASAAVPAKSSDLKPLPDRDPQLAKKLVSQGAVLLDVRTQGEWDERHLDGANHIPVDELDSRMSEIAQLTSNDKAKPIVVYCKSGGRAGRAKKKLQEAGYTQVSNMGGIGDWPKE